MLKCQQNMAQVFIERAVKSLRNYRRSIFHQSLNKEMSSEVLINESIYDSNLANFCILVWKVQSVVWLVIDLFSDVSLTLD